MHSLQLSSHHGLISRLSQSGFQLMKGRTTIYGRIGVHQRNSFNIERKITKFDNNETLSSSPSVQRCFSTSLFQSSSSNLDICSSFLTFKRKERMQQSSSMEMKKLKPIGKAHFTTESAQELTPQQKHHHEKRNRLHKRYKIFISKVHPDLFMSINEEYRKLNEESMQTLTSFFDAIWTYISEKNSEKLWQFPSPVPIKFVYKGSVYKLLKLRFFLPRSLMTKETHEDALPLLWSYYERCVEELEKELIKLQKK